MEEVWKDITLSCNLHHEIPTTPPLSLPRTNISLPDFLAEAPFKDQVAPPPPTLHHHLLLPPHTPIDLNQIMESASNLDPNSHMINIFPKKRLLDRHQQQQVMMMNVDRFGVNFIINDEDRRQKRMIKNRESASRSRARKQAYTNELQLEVAHLVQENAKLRRQYEELRSAVATQIPSMKALQRASSASF